MGAWDASLAWLAPLASHPDLTPYSQTFEGLNESDPNALSQDAWQVYASAFSPDGATLLYVRGDYDNSGAQTSGQQVQANVCQLQTLGTVDTGSTWNLHFDAHFGGSTAPSTAQAFVLTLDPSLGYALTSIATPDMSAVPNARGSCSLSLPITVAAGNNLRRPDDVAAFDGVEETIVSQATAERPHAQGPLGMRAPWSPDEPAGRTGSRPSSVLPAFRTELATLSLDAAGEATHDFGDVEGRPSSIGCVPRRPRPCKNPPWPSNSLATSRTLPGGSPTMRLRCWPTGMRS
jgi:hypothetical protein